MATSDASTVASSASRLIDREGGIVPFIQNVGFGGVMYAIILEIITGIQAVGTLISGPIRALGIGTIALVRLFLEGMGDVFGAGTQETVLFFTDGLGQLLGPLGQPFGVGIMMTSLFIFVFAAQRIPWSPWIFIQDLNPVGS